MTTIQVLYAELTYIVEKYSL